MGWLGFGHNDKFIHMDTKEIQAFSTSVLIDMLQNDSERLTDDTGNRIVAEVLSRLYQKTEG